MALRPEPVTGGQSTQEGNMIAAVYSGKLDPMSMRGYRMLIIQVDADSWVHLFISPTQAEELVKQIQGIFPELKKENHE